MAIKRKLKLRQNNDRRQTPDRRNGFDRRLNGAQSIADENLIFNTRKACTYLKISRPTYLKYIAAGKIKAQKIGNRWKVRKTELDRFVRGD